jgi:hypothetical protein
MRLNPHLHIVALDGVYVAGVDGVPVFRQLAHLQTDEVADVLQTLKTRILRTLERKGVVQVLPDALAVDDGLAVSDSTVAHLAAAAGQLIQLRTGN